VRFDKLRVYSFGKLGVNCHAAYGVTVQASVATMYNSSNAVWLQKLIAANYPGISYLKKHFI
jgi:hypothetical protein